MTCRQWSGKAIGLDAGNSHVLCLLNVRQQKAAAFAAVQCRKHNAAVLELFLELTTSYTAVVILCSYSMLVGATYGALQCCSICMLFAFCRVNMGTADEFALDMLINALSTFSKE